MYKSFFGFSRNPFGISPDPQFFFPTTRHCNAIASLFWGVQMRKGISVLSGEVGTGKTLVVRCLFNMMKRSNIAFAYVFHSRLEPLDFLRYFAADLGLDTNNKSKADLLWELNQFMFARYRENSTVALVIDEAQLLDWEVLEEVRLLTNLETSSHKLLQILLVGQPELDRKLDSNELRQLKQRVAFRCRLEPLNEAETAKYIGRRLAQAGANGSGPLLFPAETIHHIWAYSNGIPRLINNLCEHALIDAYARQARSIGPEVIREVAGELGLEAGAAAAPEAKAEPHHAKAVGQ